MTVSATASAKECPTINELAYYAFQGHPSWDGDITWSMHKHLYKGGMWFLKRSNIPNFNKNEYGGKSLLNTCPNPWVENYPARHKIPAQGRPSDLDKYFFLPATGFCGDQTTNYEFRTLTSGYYGAYWSSNSRTNTQSFLLHFLNTTVGIDSDDRYWLYIQESTWFK